MERLVKSLIVIAAILGFMTIEVPQSAFAQPSASEIAEQATFQQLSRIAPGGRYASYPQVMVVIDRAAKDGPRLYFVNTKRFEYHIDFVRGTYLSVQDEQVLLDANYSKPDRRFIFASLLYYPGLKRYGLEFWEGDVLDKTVLTTAMNMVAKHFFAPIAFKPNSEAQQELAANLSGLAAIEPDALFLGRDNLVLNNGKAVGTLRIIPRLTPDTVIRSTDIVILGEAPLQLSPVAGIITTQFSTPLAHVNLLAKSWKIPNGYLRDAASRFADLDGWPVVLIARDDNIIIRAATEEEVAKAAQDHAIKQVRLPPPDLAYRALPTLAEQRADDVVRTGAKAANLGEVAYEVSRHADIGFSVPPGFSIPFAYYADFVRANGLDKKIDALLADQSLRDDPIRRREALADLRAAFQAATIDLKFLAQVEARRAAITGDGGVFVRSSTNSEDLKGFNGAGLYTSVPNVLGREALGDAIKTVWGSIWNDRAFDAREAAGIDHRGVAAAVLIQHGVNAQASGVMITDNPFDRTERDVVFINAKRGLGLRVVEGKRLAEQLIYRPNPESVQVLTRSNDDAMTVFDAEGGVREAEIQPGRAVLTDALARRLALAGRMIQSLFGGTPQDIEWVVTDNSIAIVQARPYLSGD